MLNFIDETEDRLLSVSGESLIDMKPDLIANEMIHLADQARDLISEWSDESLDLIIEDVAKRVSDQAEFFANQTVKETGIGCSIHKQHKLKLVYKDITGNLSGVKTLGRLQNQKDTGVVEYASPIGIIFGVVPLTNPIPNSLFKALNAIKTRNALIVSYPKKATQVGNVLVSLIRQVLEEHGAPVDLLQALPVPSDRVLINQFMAHDGIDLVLATGGASLVKAAHSSGNPALGVGPGNVPAWICSDADINNAAYSVVSSKYYDHGIICGSENNLVVDQKVYPEFIDALIQQGAAVLSKDEKIRALTAWFDDKGKLKSSILGQSANSLASLANIERSYSIKIFVITASEDDVNVLAKEKLAPILSLFVSHGDDGLALVNRFLEIDGAGHTAVIHSQDKKKIDLFARKVPAGRLLVNTPATFGMMGVSTDLPLSFMLGCGSWGGNITTKAITWKDFLNIKRLATHQYDVDLNEAV